MIWISLLVLNIGIIESLKFLGMTKAYDVVAGINIIPYIFIFWGTEYPRIIIN